MDFGFWNVVHRLTTAATATTHSLSRRMNDNKQPRELSMSQSHTQWTSVVRFPFQKHTVPVQTTMTTAYTHDHTQVSTQVRGPERKQRVRSTDGAIVWTESVCCDNRRCDNVPVTEHTLTALRPSVYLIILFILNFISVPNEIFVGICSLIF